MKLFFTKEEKQILIKTASHIIHRGDTSLHSYNLRCLARIALDVLESNPVYQLVDDGKWYDAEKYLYDEAKKRGDVCRIVYNF